MKRGGSENQDRGIDEEGEGEGEGGIENGEAECFAFVGGGGASIISDEFDERSDRFLSTEGYGASSFAFTQNAERDIVGYEIDLEKYDKWFR